jgi:hypothetical protein
MNNYVDDLVLDVQKRIEIAIEEDGLVGVDLFIEARDLGIDVSEFEGQTNG